MMSTVGCKIRKQIIRSPQRKSLCSRLRIAGARNKMEVALKSHPYFENQFLFSEVNPGSELEKMVKLFEEKSRNYTGVDFSGAPSGAKKILITGFDPFFINPKMQGHNIKQSNPSGATVLALHGKTLGNGYIQAIMTPVRWSDFDGNLDTNKGIGNGIIEKYIASLIGNTVNSADIIITISQSGLGNYNIDRFATINRCNEQRIIDNLGNYRPVNSNSVHLKIDEKNLQWIETSLPLTMVMNGGASQQTDSQNHYVVFAQSYLKADGTTDISESLYMMQWDKNIDNLKPVNPAAILTDVKKPIPDLQTLDRIIIGSGGSYLSNEIFYRVALARERWQRANPSAPLFPTGHFHVAWIQVFNDLEDKYTTPYGSSPNRTVKNEMVKLIATVKERIQIAANSL